jgi:hypothetical protein
LELTHQQVQKKVRNNTKILPVAEQALNQQQTGTEQALVPYINNLNLLNNSNDLNEVAQSQINNSKTISDDNSKGDSKQQGTEKEKSSAKKEKALSSREKSRPERPLLEDVKSYFVQNNWQTIEAEKFYNHYESNGWLVGGKTPMKNWQASANNWILNSQKFVTSSEVEKRTSNLNATTNKNYNEPL